jgi:hypothetical protein
MPWLLYPQEKSHWYPLDRRLGRPHSPSGCGGEEKNSQPLLGLEHPIIQPIKYLENHKSVYCTEIGRYWSWVSYWNNETYSFCFVNVLMRL